MNAPCYNCDGTPVMTEPSAAQHLVNAIGKFPGVQQIAATPAVHELLSQGPATFAAPFLQGRVLRQR